MSLRCHDKLTSYYDVMLSPQAESLFKLLMPLIKDQEDKPATPPDPEDFAEEQWLLGRLVHLLKASTPDQQYLVSMHSN